MFYGLTHTEFLKQNYIVDETEIFVKGNNISKLHACTN